MARITLNQGDHGFSQSSFFSHPDFAGLRLTDQSRSSLTFEGQNGAFIRLKGNFSDPFTSAWTIRTMEIGRDNDVKLAAEDLSIRFPDFTGAGTEEELIELALQGSDTIISTNDGTLFWDGGRGNDYFDLGTGTDFVFGGRGTDTLRLKDSFFNAEVFSDDFYTGIITADGTDLLQDVEVIKFDHITAALQSGTSEADSLNRASGLRTPNDLIAAGAGNDTVNGRGGSDLLFGESGNDVLNGGSGADRILGGLDDDLIFGGSQNDTLLGDSGNDRLRGGSGADQLFGGSGNDDLNGKAGSDRLQGGSGNDKLIGANGKDTLRGDSGDDLLNGGNHDDRLIGGSGNDTLMGGDGNDRLTGNSGADTFVFRGNEDRNVITDFQSGADLIQIQSGAEDLSDLTFSRAGNSVRVDFADTTIVVQNTTVDELQDVDNFLFV